MRSILAIIAILTAAVSLGIIQDSKLRALKRESASLEERSASPPREHPATSPESPTAVDRVSPAERDLFREDFVSALLAFKSRTRPAGTDPVALRRKMLLAAARFESEDIEQMFQQLRADPRLGDLSRDELFGSLMGIFAETAGAATMTFLEGHRDVPDWHARFAQCQRQYLIANPREAIRDFEQRSAAGNPDLADSGIRQNILIEEARIDPDRMLARAVSPDFASDADALARLGSFVASTLNEPSEHQRFLAALRRAQAGADPHPQLEKIRAEYVAGLSNSLVDFTFEDSSALVDSEFTPDEKLALAGTASPRGDLSEPAKWADWFLKIDPEAWKEWNARKGTKGKHPASDIVSNWAQSDYQAAGKWLESVPAGELKLEMSLEYAWRIAGIDPDHAATYLHELPESKAKRNLIKKIAENRKAKDPAAPVGAGD